MKHTLLAALVSLAAVAHSAKVAALAQASVAPMNDAPSPYRTVET